jgi:hypothetical protein
MRGFLEHFGVALCGLATAILVALADVAIARATTIDIFTFMMWFVVPAGAIVAGIAAASGYYFGSLYFHKKPKWPLLLQMVAIAGFAQFLIYYIGYSTLVLDNGGKASDVVPFAQYMEVILTKAHYRLRYGTDTGEIGEAGYWIAVVQFVGFLFGGFAIFFILKAKPVCGVCDLYLRPLAKREKFFANGEAAGSYYDRLFTYPVDGPDFAGLVRMETKRDKKVAKGAAIVHTALLGCPSCKQQLIEEKIQIWNGQTWKDVDKLKRRVQIPIDVDLAAVFRR